MSRKDRDQIKKLIDTKNRRLQYLEVNHATHGVNTDPSTLMEIDDITKEIERLQTELEKSESYLDTHKSLVRPNLKTVLLAFLLAVFLISLILFCTVNIYMAIYRSSKQIMSWGFNDCTPGKWGIYDKSKTMVVKSSDVTTSTKNAQENCSLEVSNINLPAPPKFGAIKKWPAVQYDQDLSRARMTAIVYVPEDANFDYADAKLFFIDDQHVDDPQNWYECGSNGKGRHLQEGESGDRGIRLRPGEWVRISCDLPSQWWPWSQLQPSQLRGIVGIQVYVEGSFPGPVYIDDVTIYKDR